MIREVIVTSPAGVRLCFEASGEQGLVVRSSGLSSHVIDVCDTDKPCTDGPQVIGVVPTSWLLELNDVAT